MALRVVVKNNQSNMASTPGQNVHLVVSSSHLVVSSLILTSPLLVYYSVILQLVLSPFNSSCGTSTRMASTPGQNVHRVVSSSHLVVPSLLLTSPLLVYLYHYSYTYYHYSSCHSSTRRYLYMRILMKQDKPDYLHLIVKLVV